jgi:hypothetical protein
LISRLRGGPLVMRPLRTWGELAGGREEKVKEIWHKKNRLRAGFRILVRK